MLPEGLRLASVLMERAIVHQWMRNKKGLQTRGCVRDRARWEPYSEISRKNQGKEALMERWTSSSPTFEGEKC